MSTAGSTIFQAPMQKTVYDTDQNDIVDRAEVAVPSAHDLSGALHNVSTLANLNLKISDATLIDTTDSRLSDDRDPNAHALEHVDGTDDIRDATNALKGLATAAQITALEANTVHRGVVTGNPHDVTKGEVGLGNVDNTSDVNKPVSTAQQTALDLKINLTQKGAANGVATLDAGSKIPVTQLPSSVMEYKGSWSVVTNTPALADGVGDNGDIYRVSDAGTRDLGSGNQTWAIGDWVTYNGTIWEKSPGSDAVFSVAGKVGVVTLNHATDLSNVGTKSHAIIDTELGAAYTHSQLAQIAELENLTVAEVQQLENIGTVTISAAQWGYLGGLNQALASTNNVAFNQINLADDKKIYFGAPDMFIQWKGAGGWGETIADNVFFGNVAGTIYMGIGLGTEIQFSNGSNDIDFRATINVFNDSLADVDIQFKGDTDANLGWIDAGLNKWGIGVKPGTANWEIFNVEGNIMMKEGSSPANQITGYGKCWWNSANSNYYAQNDSGVDFQLTEQPVTIPMYISNGGGVIAAGEYYGIRIGFACEITKATINSDQSTTTVADIWVDSFANYPPTVADTITAAAKPTLTAAIKSEDSTLTGWTKTINAGDYIFFKVDSNNNATWLGLFLDVKRTA
jgi:hypothetical protein